MVQNFPNVRMRRLRSSQVMRDLLQEHTLSMNDLIYPIFVEEGLDDYRAGRTRCPASSASRSASWTARSRNSPRPASGR